MKKAFLLLIILIFSFLCFIEIPKVYAEPDKTISYDPSTNIITAIGGNETDPINFNDLWLADKDGDLQLKSSTAISGFPGWALDQQVRPSDELAITLTLIITDFVNEDDLIIQGKDLKENVFEESITITGNGTYYTTPPEYFRTVSAIYTDLGVGDFKLEVRQSLWGVVWKTGDSQFMFDARIILGNGTVAGTTWFIDSDKQITFSPISFSANNQILIDVTTNATFRSGILEDSATKRTYGGCQFITNASSYVGSAFVRGYNGLVELYSTVVDNLEQKVYTLIYDEGKIYNCIFRGASIWGTSTSNIDAEKVILQKGISALDHPMGSLNDIWVYDHDYAVIYYQSDIFTLKNFEARGNDIAIRCYAISANGHLINADIDNWYFSWYGSGSYKVYRQYEFDLTIFFENGSSIENANVTISNDYLETSNSWLTYSNGSIPQQIYSYGHYQQSGGNSIYDYNPYNITVTYEGYETYTDMINIIKKEDLRICLCPVKASYGLGLGSGFILAFILSMALLAVGALAIKRRS